MNAFKAVFVCTAFVGSILASIVPATAFAAVVPRSLSTQRTLAYAPSGFSSMRVRFEHSLIADDGALVANYERRFGISTVFVQLGGDDTAGLIDRNPTTVKNIQAMLAVGKVYFVIGDPAWLSAPATPPTEIVTAAKIARAYPGISGVLIDLDPARLPAWNTNARQTLVSEYLTLVGTILAMPSLASFKQTQFVADTRFLLVHQNGDPRRPTVLELLQTAPAIGAFQLEIPGHSTQRQLQNGATSIAQMTRPFSVVATTSKYSPDSYYAVAPEYLRISLANESEHVA
jgi:hypothetical protein